MSLEDIAQMLVGRAATRVERWTYDYQGELDECGDLHLWFGSDVVRLHVGSDMVIAAASDPWPDPFAGSTEDNAEYFRTHGRFVLVDVTCAENYKDLVGTPIRRVLPLANKFGQLSGVSLETETVTANVHVVGDDLAVTWGGDIPRW